MRTLPGCLSLAVLLFLALSQNQLPAAAGDEPKEWQNPKLTGLNNQPPHAIMVACPDVKAARSIELVNNRERAKSSFYRSLNDAEWETTYIIYGTGDILVKAHFRPGNSNLPKMVRVGMQMTLPAGFEQLTWLGPGPQETYADRKDAKVGRYHGAVETQFYGDYTKPGETGNKVDARWIALTNNKGTGLLAVGQPLLSVNALHYGTEDLNAGKHAFELPHRDFITLNLDLEQQGVGGDDSWGAWPHQQFLIPCEQYSYSFRLRPFGAGENPERLARQVMPAQ